MASCNQGKTVTHRCTQTLFWIMVSNPCVFQCIYSLKHDHDDSLGKSCVKASCNYKGAIIERLPAKELESSLHLPAPSQPAHFLSLGQAIIWGYCKRKIHPTFCSPAQRNYPNTAGSSFYSGVRKKSLNKDLPRSNLQKKRMRLHSISSEMLRSQFVCKHLPRSHLQKKSSGLHSRSSFLIRDHSISSEMPRSQVRKKRSRLHSNYHFLCLRILTEHF